MGGYSLKLTLHDFVIYIKFQHALETIAFKEGVIQARRYRIEHDISRYGFIKYDPLKLIYQA